MKNPGKYLIIWLVVMTPLLAGTLNVTVDSQKVYQGEPVRLNVEASGDDVEPPALSEVCGTKISSSAQRTSIQMINGNYTKSYTWSYEFTPTTDCRIDPVMVTIDGEVTASSPIDITVVPMSAVKDAPFVLEMSSDKETVYVGEPFRITVTLKQLRNSNAVDSKFVAPEFTGFWLKEQQQSRRFEEGDYTVTRLHFVIAAQKAGEFVIKPSEISIATRVHVRDAISQIIMPQLRWRKYFSNPLDITVKKLPDDITLVGDFDIAATVDRQRVNANEPVNLDIVITGSGNFEDIGTLKPSLEGVSVYGEKPTTKAYIENDTYKGTWREKLALVSDKDFIVPPIELRYYDLSEQRVKTIRTAAITLEVNGAAQPKADAAELTIKRPSEAKTAESAEEPTVSPFEKGAPAGFVVGLITGALLMLVMLRIPWKQYTPATRRGTDVPKGDRETLKYLMAFADDKEVSGYIADLEAEIYEGKSGLVDKNALKKLLKRLKKQP
jgi:hypothetical protein